MKMNKYSSTEAGSDKPRNLKQFIFRNLAQFLVKILRLNKSSDLSTEIVQSIHPIIEVKTPYGNLKFKGGHGRLVWRTKTYESEEPETINWLNTLSEQDTLWDVGANVGMYSIYAAVLRKCQVIAFEPEAQNYALLLENIALNGINNNCDAVSIAVGPAPSGFGYLNIRYITKGGAYNQFTKSGKINDEIAMPSTEFDNELRQVVYSLTLDEILKRKLFPEPTHLKVDVDGLEGMIFHHSEELLGIKRLRTILVELDKNNKIHMEVPNILRRNNFKIVSARSNWESRKDKTLEGVFDDTNMIFSRI